MREAELETIITAPEGIGRYVADKTEKNLCISDVWR